MSTCIELPKYQSETIPLEVDFSSRLRLGESIAAATFNIQVWSGVDPGPNAMILGDATVSGTVVTQVLRDGVAGVIYLCTFSVRSSSNMVYQNQVKLAVLSSPTPTFSSGGGSD